MQRPTVFLASDHRGFALKSKLLIWLAEHKFEAKDLGTNSEERCDAGDFATRLALQISKNAMHFGILICGTGQAMTMTANRYKHLRAALCSDSTVARLSRQHNDANVLVLGADITGDAVALDCLDVFLNTEFLCGRYAERRDKLTALGGIDVG